MGPVGINFQMMTEFFRAKETGPGKEGGEGGGSCTLFGLEVRDFCS